MWMSNAWNDPFFQCETPNSNEDKPKGSAHVVCARKSLLAVQPSAQITTHFVPGSEVHAPPSTNCRVLAKFARTATAVAG
jgi:hypothetical protein